MKKILSIILSLCMLVSLCTGLTTVPAFGQEPEFEEATDSETGSGGNPDEPGSGDNVSAGDFEEIHWPNASYEKQTDADALFDDAEDTYISVPAGAWLTFELAEDFATAFSGMRFFESTAGTNGITTATVQVSDDGAYYYDVTAEVSQEDSFTDVLFTNGEGTPYSVNAKFVRIKSSAAWDISGLNLIEEEAETAELPEDITEAVKETLGDTYSYDYLSPYDSYIGSVGSNGGWNARYNKYTALKKLVEQPDGTGVDYWSADITAADSLEARTITLMFNGPLEIGGVELYPRTGDRQYCPGQVGLIGLYEDQEGNIQEKVEEVNITSMANPVPSGTTLPLYFSDEAGYELVGLKVVIRKTCANAVRYDGQQNMMLSGVGILAPKAKADRGTNYEAKPFAEDEIYVLEPKVLKYKTTSSSISYGSVSLDAGTSETSNNYAFDHLRVDSINSADYDGATSVQLTNAINGGTTWLEIDLGKEETFAGVRVYSRISDNGQVAYNNEAIGVQNITKGNLYISDDGETWYLVGAFAGNKANIQQNMKASIGGTEYNITARYLKVECTEVFNSSAQKNWSFAEIGLLKPKSENDTITAEDLENMPGITNEGTITIDKTEDPISVEEIELKNDTEIASVEILNGEEVIATLDSDDYTVSDNTLTFSDEFAGSLRAGAYTVKITFADAFDTVAEIDLTVIFERPLILTDLTEEDFEEISWINASYEKQTEADALFDDADATFISVPKGTDITFGLSADYEKAFYGIRFFKKSDGANYLNTAKAWVSEDGAYFYEVTPQIVNEATYTDVTLTDGTAPYKVGVRYVKIRVNDASATTWDISEISFLEALENDNEFATLPDDIAGAVLASESGKYGYEHLDQSSSYIGSVGTIGEWNARYNKYTALKKMVEQPDGTGADYWTVDTAMVDQTEARTITLMFNGPIKVGGVELYPRKGDWQWVPKQVGLIGLYEDENGEIKEKTEIVTKTLADNTLSTAYETLPLYFSNEEGEELVGLKVVIAKTCANAVTYDAAQLMMLTGVSILAPKAEDDRVGNYYVAKPFNDSEIYRVAPREVTFGTTSTQTDPGASTSLRLFDHLKVNQANAGASYDEAAFVEMANALNGGTTWFEFDLGAEVTLSGVNVYARISDNGQAAYNNLAIGVQNITKGNLYVSKDGETWYLAGTFAGNKANICQEMKISLGETEFNITARYIKVECTEVYNSSAQKNWSLTEIGLAKPNSENETIAIEDLANLPGITNEGAITIDKTEEPISIDAITLKNDTEIASVEILKGEDVVETLEAEVDYTVSGTTLTFASEFASSLSVGEYTVKITFVDVFETVAEIGLTVKDEKVASLLLIANTGADNPPQQSTIVLRNLYPEVEAPVVKIGETEIVSSVTEEGIVINRTDLVSAYDIYEGMALTGNELILTVTYGENSVEYPLIVTTDWFTSADKTVPTWEGAGKIYKNAVFAADEVDAAYYNDFRVRSDSTVGHKRWNAINAFLVDVPEGVPSTYTYHSKTGSPRNYIDVDFGTPVEVGGLRYLARLNGANYQGLLNKIVILGSNTLNGEDWVILYDGSAVGTEKSYDLIFEEKATYQYYRLYMEGSENYVSVAGFHFLKPIARILGEAQYDTAADFDVVINIKTYEPEQEIEEIRLNGEVLSAHNYEVSNGTVTIKKECFEGAQVGESYPLVITFNNESSVETAVEIVNGAQFEFKFIQLAGATSYERTDTITLNNLYRADVQSVILEKDGTVIPFSANEETITITRSDFRKAFDVYAEMGLEGGKVKLLVTFTDGRTISYTINLSGGWVTTAAKDAAQGTPNTAATFGEDEIDIVALENFKVRTDSMWTANHKWAHPMNAFYYEAIEDGVTGARYHSGTDEGNIHYIDVDFGQSVSVGGLRYIARYDGAPPVLQPKWENVVVKGSDDFETWETLFEGSANSGWKNDMYFNENAEVQYLRIYIKGNTTIHANAIRILKPATRIVGSAQYDTAVGEDAEIKYSSYPEGLAVTGVTLNGEVLEADADYVATDGTVTIKKELFQGFQAGESYPLVITFNNESSVETAVEIIDSSLVEFKLNFAGEAFERTDNIILKNIKGLSVSKVVLKKDGTEIPFTADEETITIKRSDFRKAFDVYAEMGLEEGKIQLLVKFEDGSFLTYTVNVLGGWLDKSRVTTKNAEFKKDEIDIITSGPKPLLFDGSWTITSVGFKATGAERIANIFDGNPLTYAHSYMHNTDPAFDVKNNDLEIVVDFGREVILNALSWKHRIHETHANPAVYAESQGVKHYKLYAINDGVVAEAPFKEGTLEGIIDLQEIALEEPVVLDGIKVWIEKGDPDGDGSGTTAFTIADINLVEYVPDKYENFKVRADSVWSNALNHHPINAFLKAEIAEGTTGENYHAQANPDEGTKHYIDIDFGVETVLGGLRYIARTSSKNVGTVEAPVYEYYNDPNWKSVTILGATEFGSWETLYEGSANNAAQHVYDLYFSKNATVRYLRVYIGETSYPTANVIRFLNPTIRVFDAYGNFVETVILDKNSKEDIVVYTDLPVTGVKVGGKTTTGYKFDKETNTLTIKADALTAIKTAGTSSTIEVLSGSSVATINVQINSALFKNELVPSNDDYTIKLVVGKNAGGLDFSEDQLNRLIDRKIIKKADGSEISTSDNTKNVYKMNELLVEGLKDSNALEIYIDKATNRAPVIELDYKVPHTFSGVRVYHRVWEGNGTRNFSQSMKKAYLQVSNDGVNWLTSDTWSAKLDKGVNKHVFDDIEFTIKGEKVNVTARYVRICIVTTSNPTSLVEVALCKPGTGRSLNPAEITFEGEKAIYSLADPKDMTFDVVYGEAVALTGMKAVKGETVVSVASTYIKAEDTKITINKAFFEDNKVALMGDFDFVMSFVLGEDVIVPVAIAEAETHNVTFRVEGGNATITAKNGDVTYNESPAVGAKRHEEFILTATLSDGFEAVWSIEENINTTYKEIPVIKDKDWTITSVGFKPSATSIEGAVNVFDGDPGTYAHSDTQGENAFDTVNNDLEIKAEFGREITLSAISWQHRVGFLGQGVINYKLYAINDGVVSETPFKEGTLESIEGKQSIEIEDIVLDGIKVQIVKGKSHFSIADINLFETVSKDKDITVTGSVVRKGTSTEDFKIEDLYSDAVITLSTVPVKKGSVKVTTDHVGLTSDAPKTASKGEILEVELTPHEGEQLPDDIREITQDGHVLINGQDFYYVIVTPEEEVSLFSVSREATPAQIGVIRIFNVRGDIHIVADADGITRRKVSFTDEYGAKGTLPDTKFYKVLDEIEIPASSLKLTGYTLEGWNWTGEDVAEGEEYTLYKKGDSFVMPDADVTFVAVWKVKENEETERPALGGGGAGDSDDDDHESFGGGGFGGVSDKFQVVVSGIGTQAVTKGTVLNAPAVEAGYEFVGWYLDAAYTVPYANSGVTGNLTVYPYIRKIRQATDLADIQNHWAKEAISKMYVDYIVNGKSETAFDPDSDITRAEFCQILYKISGQTSDGSENFADVNVGDWYINAVAWAVNQGITMGTTEDTFSPYAKITREQMATMIYRYATKVGAAWEISGEASFADKTDISTYANYQVNWAADKGVISGYPDGTFGPAKEATRAEAVVMLTRLINLLSK